MVDSNEKEKKNDAVVLSGEIIQDIKEINVGLATEEIRKYTEEAVKSIISDITVNASLQTAARAKALIEAYARIFYNFSSYIISQSEKINDPNYAMLPLKEVAVAKLVADWLLKIEGDLGQSVSLVKESGGVVQHRFTEMALESLPVDLKDKALTWLIEKKQQLLVEFGTLLNKLKQEAKERM